MNLILVNLVQFIIIKITNTEKVLHIYTSFQMGNGQSNHHLSEANVGGHGLFPSIKDTKSSWHFSIPSAERNKGDIAIFNRNIKTSCYWIYSKKLEKGKSSIHPWNWKTRCYLTQVLQANHILYAKSNEGNLYKHRNSWEVHPHQHRVGKSTDTALLDLTEIIQKIFHKPEVLVCAFIIEGAFDNTSHEPNE